MKTTLLSVAALLALMALAGCGKSEGGAAAEVSAKTGDTKPVAGEAPKIPANVNVPAAQNSSAFADAMKKQAQQGIPK